MKNIPSGNYKPTKSRLFRPNQSVSSASFVCFYCRGNLQQGTGRRFRLIEDGPVWEVHSRHAMTPSEITVPEETE